jgi:hypothetical protein
MSLSHSQKKLNQKTHSIDPCIIDVVGGGYDDTLFLYGKKPDKVNVEMVYAIKQDRISTFFVLISKDQMKKI